MLRTRSCIVAVIGLTAAGGSAAAQDRFIQDQAQFRAAIENGSTSPSFVFVTVRDGKSGEQRTGCTNAGFLLHAIATEEGFDRRDYHGRMLPDDSVSVIAKALSSKDHIYTFQKVQALAAVPTDVQGSNRACEIIRSGMPAYMQDRTGQIMPGQP